MLFTHGPSARAARAPGPRRRAPRSCKPPAGRPWRICRAPGRSTPISGFILLGDWLETKLGRRLDVAASEVFASLGVRTLAYRPIGDLRGDVGSGIAGPVAAAGAAIAATERCSVRGRVVVGEVHDLNAYAMGGVAGHAGLFGDAQGVATVAHALLRRLPRLGLAAGARPLVDREVLRRFWRPAGVPGSTWRLGWDGPSPSGRSRATASAAPPSGTWPSPAAHSGSTPSARCSCWCCRTGCTRPCARTRTSASCGGPSTTPPSRR